MEVDDDNEQRGGNSSIIELNVGGRRFSTTRATLQQHPSSYFARLLDDNGFLRGAQRDSKNRIFIDRDPDVFALILEYLRWTIDIDRLTEREMEKLRKEALYYQLDGLLDMLPRPPYDPSQLSKDDQAIRSQAQHVRESLKRRLMDAQEEVDSLLIDLFPNVERSYTLYDSPLTSPKSTILFDKQVEMARSQREIYGDPPATLEEFQHRLVEFAGPLLESFPMENLVIAGGSVLQCLQGFDTNHRALYGSASDIDLFLIADDEETAKATFDRILNHLAGRRGVENEIEHHELLVVRSALTVTFCIGYPQRHLQLILRLNQCIGDVIFNFDADCCQVAYDGKRVLATPSAHRALSTGINIADPERCGLLEDYEGRHAKYADRGFLVAVPGLESSKIKDEYIRNCCYCFHEGKLKRAHLNMADFEDYDKKVPSIRIGEQPVEGLAKLIVYSTVYTYPLGLGMAAANRVVPVRFQDVTIASQGDPASGAPLGTGNYLIKYPITCSEWKKETPPYPPPANILHTVGSARYPGFGTAGGPLLPFWEDFDRPRKIFQHLNSLTFHVLPEVKVERDRRLVCYDLLRNVEESTACPNVMDAQLQYPNWPFIEMPGRLTRHLQFVNLEPWERMSEEKWNLNVYQEERRAAYKHGP